MALLELKNITAGYDQNIILKDFDLSVEKGEFVSLLGSSGCGKTTCLRMIAGFSEPMAGQIIFNGQDYTKVPLHKRNFGFVFQSYALFPHLSVLQNVAYARTLDKEFTFYVVYGSCTHSVDYTKIKIHAIEDRAMEMDEVDEYIRQNIGRKIVVVGASTGTDAHTVGIDAIMNRKGFAGHYGLERYEMIDAYNLGSQVPNEEFLAKARELNADVLLVSQTVTQKNIHIQNLTELIELAEAEGMRAGHVMCCGGARITHELAKELGYDAGFGPGKFANDVASFCVKEMVRRGIK